jgi:hypothetical protein
VKKGQNRERGKDKEQGKGEEKNRDANLSTFCTYLKLIIN